MQANLKHVIWSRGQQQPEEEDRLQCREPWQHEVLQAERAYGNKPLSDNFALTLQKIGILLLNDSAS